MATKFEYSPLDIAAQQIIDAAVAESGYSYREIDRMTDGAVKYSRIRDICVARRAPVRLSEFVDILVALQQSPITALKRAIARAAEIESEQQQSNDWTQIAARAVANINSVDLVAKRGDIQAEQDAMEELP